jgi:hypothetical protein
MVRIIKGAVPRSPIDERIENLVMSQCIYKILDTSAIRGEIEKPRPVPLIFGFM